MSSLLTLAGNAAPTGFYDFPIEQSLRFNDDDNAYLSRTPASAGNRKTWTFSCWVKRGKVSGTDAQILTAYTSASDTTNILFLSGGAIQWYDYISGYRVHLVTNALFRDVGSWYHFLFQLDTSNATSGDRAKIYVNGERVTSFSTEVYPSLNADLKMNTAIEHRIGDTAQFAREFDGYMADVNFIDGQALEPTSFGQFKSGIWTPVDTSGLTFGTNGFRLQFGDSAAIGDDTSGNTNDWTANNLVASDAVLDGVTNNFATMNPLAKGSGTVTFSEGNLKSSFTFTLTTTEHGSTYTLPQSGKWYWEQRFTGALTDGSQALLCGIMDVDTLTVGNSGNKLTSSGDYVTFYTDNNTIYINNSSTAYTSEITDQTSAIVGFAVDMDNGHLWVHVNGTYINGTPNFSTGGNKVASPNTDSTYMPFFNGNGGGSGTWIANFGQDSTFANNTTAGGNADENGYGDFKYALPSGFLSLCSANLPSGAINTLNDETPEDYFNTVLYTGDGVGQSITGVGFQADWTWIKCRSAASSHSVYDVNRGVYKALLTDSTSAELNLTGAVTSFTSDGFTLGTEGLVNTSGRTYVGWNWKAGGSGVSNTDGDIASTVSVGATSQQNWFSVVSYTGNGSNAQTVGHGLATVPSFIVVKPRNYADHWSVYHASLGATKYLYLNGTNSVFTGNSRWSNTEPTENVFTIGTSSPATGGGYTYDYIAYCFANAEGLCRAGSYVGNGSADGPMIFTGFRASAIIAKNIDDGTANWWFHDNKRLGYNANNYALFPNLNQAEDANVRLDILSNGFKIRNTAKHWNTSGQTYIYLAIAEQDFRFANAR